MLGLKTEVHLMKGNKILAFMHQKTNGMPTAMDELKEQIIAAGIKRNRFTMILNNNAQPTAEETVIISQILEAEKFSDLFIF